MLIVDILFLIIVFNVILIFNPDIQKRMIKYLDERLKRDEEYLRAYRAQKNRR